MRGGGGRGGQGLSWCFATVWAGGGLGGTSDPVVASDGQIPDLHGGTVVRSSVANGANGENGSISDGGCEKPEDAGSIRAPWRWWCPGTVSE